MRFRWYTHETERKEDMIRGTIQKAIAVMAGATLALSLVACGGSGTGKGDTGKDDTTKATQTQQGSDSSEKKDTGKDSGKDSGSATPATPSSSVMTEPLDNGYSTGKHEATIVVKDYGTIKLELDADVAPISVSNFAELANNGFYDGLTFHRIMSNFMIQGGDPLGTGMGGSDTQIKGEFSSNGVENPISHVKGTISMARSSVPDSASSQFFICNADSTFLDGDYAAFGHVTEGMDVVEKITKDANPVDDNGTIPSAEQPVIESIRVGDGSLG